MGRETGAYAPSVGDYADTSPAKLGRRTEKSAPMSGARPAHRCHPERSEAAILSAEVDGTEEVARPRDDCPFPYRLFRPEPLVSRGPGGRSHRPTWMSYC